MPQTLQEAYFEGWEDALSAAEDIAKTSKGYPTETSEKIRKLSDESRYQPVRQPDTPHGLDKPL